MNEKVVTFINVIYGFFKNKITLKRKIHNLNNAFLFFLFDTSVIF